MRPLRIAAVAGVIVAAAVLVINSRKPPYTIPNSPAEAKKMGERDGKLKHGDIAPDFNLNAMRSQESVRLSSFKNKRPVALIFGSYT